MAQTSSNDQRVALITGAATGIGAACAKALANDGFTVVGVDVSDAEGKRVFDDLGAPHQYRTLDVRSMEQWQATIAAVLRDFGRLDIVHLNAGVMTRPKGQPLLDDALDWFKPDGYRKVMSVNLDGVVYGMMAALAAPMLKHVIVTASGAAILPLAMDPFYTASKYAALGLVLSLAPSFEQRGVRLDVICPGAIDTSLTAPDIRAALRQEPVSFIAESVLEIITKDIKGPVWLAFNEAQGLQRYEPPGLPGVSAALDLIEEVPLPPRLT